MAVPDDVSAGDDITAVRQNELFQAVRDEITDRASGDTSLGTRIDNLPTPLTEEQVDARVRVGVGPEVSARTSADTALGTRIDNLVIPTFTRYANEAALPSTVPANTIAWFPEA